jgi:dynein heavy chain
MLLEDHVVKSQAMAASPFSKPFEERLVPWEQKMQRLQVGPRMTSQSC